MKLIITMILPFIGTVMGAGVALADEQKSYYEGPYELKQKSYYEDLYELKQLHVAFHQAISHAGVDSASKAKHLADVLALWADDGVLVAGGVMYSGKGVPDTASCAAGSLTLCDFFANHAGSFVLGRDWVSLTPIFTEVIKVHERGREADIYWQCIYLDANNNDLKVSNTTIGLPGKPDTGQAKKVHGRWLFLHVETQSVPPPTIDVYQ